MVVAGPVWCCSFLFPTTGSATQPQCPLPQYQYYKLVKHATEIRTVPFVVLRILYKYLQRRKWVSHQPKMIFSLAKVNIYHRVQQILKP